MVPAPRKIAATSHSRCQSTQKGESRNAGQQNPSVGLEGETDDVAIGAGVETGVKRAISIDACDEVAGDRVFGSVGLKGVERPAEDDFAVGLHQQGADRAVGGGIKTGVDGSVCVQPGEAVAADRIPGEVRREAGEGAADQELAVAERQDRADGCAGSGVKREIERAVLI